MTIFSFKNTVYEIAHFKTGFLQRKPMQEDL